MTDQATIKHPDDFGTYVTPQGEQVTVLTRGDEAGADFDLLEFTIPEEPGFVPKHVHHETDEAFYVLEGTLEIDIGDRTAELTPGSFAFGPRGVPHAYRNVGDGAAHLLVLYTPGTFVSMMDEIEALGDIDFDDESAIGEILPIFEKYGLEILEVPPGM